MPTRNAGELALALQTARGSVAASSTQRIATVSGKLAPSFGLTQSSNVRTNRSPEIPWIPAVGGAGDVQIYTRPKILGLLLYATLGTKSVSGASDPFTHTFTPATVLPWMTAWSHFGQVLDERFLNVRVARLTIQSTAGGAVYTTASLVASAAASRTAQETTVAAETADTLLHRHGASALLLEGSAFTSIMEWTLTIDTGVRLEQSLAGPMPRMAGLMTITLDIKHKIPDAALWKRAVYGSASPANLTAPQTTPLTLGGSPVGAQFKLTAASSPERSLQIALPQVALGPSSDLAGVPDYGPIITTTRLLAYAPSAGSIITATLKNSQTSY